MLHAERLVDAFLDTPHSPVMLLDLFRIRIISYNDMLIEMECAVPYDT